MAALKRHGLSAGDLTHRVTIQQLGTAQDTAGQQVQTWTAVATVWADVRFLNGLESIKADAPVGVVAASIRIRYRAGVLPAMRVLYDGAFYDIKAVLPDPTGRVHLDLAVEVGVNLG